MLGQTGLSLMLSLAAAQQVCRRIGTRRTRNLPKGSSGVAVHHLLCKRHVPGLVPRSFAALRTRSTHSRWHVDRTMTDRIKVS